MRRAIRSECKRAPEDLTRGWPPSDEAIHEARKRIKKARAGLRLLRAGLPARVYRRENQALRDAARPLSQVRDGKILVDALDKLTRNAPELDGNAVRRLRSRLMARRVRARSQAVGSERSLEPVIRALRSARRRVPTPSGGRGWSVLGPSLQRVYRSGRLAAAAAAQRPTDERLHEWRKQAKYLWHELQILEPVRPATVRTMATQLHRLSDRLGDDHDLAVLRRNAGASRALSRTALRSIRKAIDARRRRLQSEATRLGRRAYRQKPGDFARRLEGYWRSWKSARK